MADTTRSISESLAACALTLGLEWNEYGQPNSEDFVVVLDSVINHLDQFEGPVAMEVPATNVKVDRDDEGLYNVYLRLGTIERNDDGVEAN
jgi:hypothetical protein